MSQSFRAGCRFGFTLLEVMVALALLAGSLLAVAPVLTMAGRAVALSRTTALASNLAAQKMEQLRHLAWAFDAGGAPVEEVGPSPPGSLAADMPGFVDYLDETGGWICGGSSPPERAAFTRRWSIAPEGAAEPAPALCFRVVVLRRVVPSTGFSGPDAGWLEAARVVGARARRAG